jgi:hypothetical protein
LKYVYEFTGHEGSYPLFIIFNTCYESAPEFKDIFGILEPGFHFFHFFLFLYFNIENGIYKLKSFVSDKWKFSPSPHYKDIKKINLNPLRPIDSYIENGIEFTVEKSHVMFVYFSD